MSLSSSENLLIEMKMTFFVSNGQVRIIVLSAGIQTQVKTTKWKKPDVEHQKLVKNDDHFLPLITHIVQTSGCNNATKKRSEVDRDTASRLQFMSRCNADAAYRLQSNSPF